MLSARGWCLVAALLVSEMNPILGQSQDVEVLERVQELENVILKLQARVVGLEKRLEISELESSDRCGNGDVSPVPQEHTTLSVRLYVGTGTKDSRRSHLIKTFALRLVEG